MSVVIEEKSLRPAYIVELYFAAPNISSCNTLNVSNLDVGKY